MTRLKISRVDDDSIQLEAIAEYIHHGFGTFLTELKPEEIECDSFSKNALLNAKYQNGLNALELWGDNRIAWGTTNLAVIVDLKTISKEIGANAWLKLIKPIADKDIDKLIKKVKWDVARDSILLNISSNNSKLSRAQATDKLDKIYKLLNRLQDE